VINFLEPYLGKFKLPVNIYAIVIITMGRLAWIRFSRTT